MIMADDELWKKIDQLTLLESEIDYCDFSDHIGEEFGTSCDNTALDKNIPTHTDNRVEDNTDNLQFDYMKTRVIPDERLKALDEKSPESEIKNGELTPSHIVTGIINDLVEKIENEQSIVYRTGIAYDARMSKYRCTVNHPERPERIKFIYQKLIDIKLVDRCKLIEPRLATTEELQTRHSLQHITLINSVQDMDYEELEQLATNYNSIYFHPAVSEASLLSAGCTIALMEEVLTGKVLNGAAVIRPPGHHALNHCSMGFCHFNNVAIAAMVAIEKYNLSRVLIVDWDVHYGNGTHKMFENDPRVLFFSMHRYDHGRFWPNLKEANFDAVGVDAGEGFNIHVAWNDGEMGDAEYLLAFEKVLMPVAKEYNPELVIVSAGFDSGAGDPIGDYNVSPLGYAHMTHKLMTLAGGKVILVLEGGYNLHTIAESMAASVLTLSSDTVPPLKLQEASSTAIRSVKNTYTAIKKYWTCLRDKDF